MGRAFPEIQMIIATMHGVKATPMTLADEKGNSAVIDTIDNSWTERLARTLTVDFGATSMIALYPMTGSAAEGGRVRRGDDQPGGGARATRARDARGARRPDRRCRRAARGRAGCSRGKVVDVARRTEAGWAKAEARIEGTGADAGSALVLQTQNEHLVAIRDGEVVCSVPDLIVVMDAETGGPITTEELRYGFRVVVIGAPCVPAWRTAEGLAIVGPRYFGYDIDFVPVEERFPGMTFVALETLTWPEAERLGGDGRCRPRRARVARAARPALAACDRLAARRAGRARGRGAAVGAGCRDAGRSRRALDAPPRLPRLGDCPS